MLPATGRTPMLRTSAQVPELVDGLDLGSSVLKGVGVRLPPWAPCVTSGHANRAQMLWLRDRQRTGLPGLFPSTPARA